MFKISGVVQARCLDKIMYIKENGHSSSFLFCFVPKLNFQI